MMLLCISCIRLYFFFFGLLIVCINFILVRFYIVFLCVEDVLYWVLSDCVMDLFVYFFFIVGLLYVNLSFFCVGVNVVDLSRLFR